MKANRAKSSVTLSFIAPEMTFLIPFKPGPPPGGGGFAGFFCFVSYRRLISRVSSGVMFGHF